MKNKKLLKNVIYLAVLGIVLTFSTFNVLADDEAISSIGSCSGGEYMNRKEIPGENCLCGDKTIQQISCEFEQGPWCNSSYCYD